MALASVFEHRFAVQEDLDELRALVTLSIRQLIGARLDAATVEASFDIMGVDTQLIADRTYFAVEERQTIVGCGGWSRRATSGFWPAPRRRSSHAVPSRPAPR